MIYTFTITLTSSHVDFRWNAIHPLLEPLTDVDTPLLANMIGAIDSTPRHRLVIRWSRWIRPVATGVFSTDDHALFIPSE